MSKNSPTIIKKKRPTNDAIRAIGSKGLIKLNDLYLADFHQGTKWPGSNAERWFNMVLDFLSIRGDEVIPFVLREQEERVIMLGKSQEYMAALTDIVYSGGCRTEYDKAVLVLTASPEERAQALNFILNGGK